MTQADNKLHPLPEYVTESLAFYERCKKNPNCAGFYIIQSRHAAKSWAHRIATETDDIPYEIIQPKLLK